MRLNRALLLILSLTTINFVVVFAVKYDRQKSVPIPSENQFTVLPIDFLPPAPILPITKVVTRNPGHLSYSEINNQLRRWENEAKDLVDIGNYGSSTEGQVLTYVKITNELNKTPKPKVLIMACIHANECLATGVAMTYLGSMLDLYDEDSEIATILNTKEIWFIPLCSPDSFPNKREVDGVDPNRDFIDKKSPITRALQELHLKEKFVSVASLHTFGRMYLIPWGEKTQLPLDYELYKNLIGQMAEKSNYRLLRACEIYGTPIYGGELDWFYKNKAFSIVVELGTHQRIPTKEEIEYEKNRTWDSFVLFLKI